MSITAWSTSTTCFPMVFGQSWFLMVVVFHQRRKWNEQEESEWNGAWSRYFSLDFLSQSLFCVKNHVLLNSVIAVSKYWPTQNLLDLWQPYLNRPMTTEPQSWSLILWDHKGLQKWVHDSCLNSYQIAWVYRLCFNRNLDQDRGMPKDITFDKHLF